MDYLLLKAKEGCFLRPGPGENGVLTRWLKVDRLWLKAAKQEKMYDFEDY